MAKENKRRPKSGWRQLDFSTLICSPEPKCAAIFFFCVFVFGLVLTSVILSHSFEIFEKTEEIGDDGRVEFKLDSEDVDNIKGDLFVYLEYENYFQNHRIYLKSKSKEQLANEDSSSLSTDCSPLYKKSDLEGNLEGKIKVFDGNKILPCGLMPASYVNTTITAQLDEKSIEIDEDDITWSTDDDKKYQQQDDSYLDITDDHFIVWMRNSPTNRLKKLYGRIKNDDVKKGTLAFTIDEDENILGYNPDKFIKISTNNRLGGKNSVLGWTFFVITALSLIWSITFAVISRFHKYPTFQDVLQKRKNPQS
jgi:hypothetical protein